MNFQTVEEDFGILDNKDGDVGIKKKPESVNEDVEVNDVKKKDSVLEDTVEKHANKECANRNDVEKDHIIKGVNKDDVSKNDVSKDDFTEGDVDKEDQKIEYHKTKDHKKEDVEIENVKIEDVEIKDVEIEDVEIDDVKIEDVKKEEVKTEDIKTEDIKTEDVKTEDVKREDSKLSNVKNKNFQLKDVIIEHNKTDFEDCPKMAHEKVKGANSMSNNDENDNEKTEVEDDGEDESTTAEYPDIPSTSSLDSIPKSDSAEMLADCKEFISNMSDPCKFSYVGLCATTLHLLFGEKADREYRHHFLTSLVAHLSLRSNVMLTMHAISDGQALGDCSQQFLADLLQDDFVKANKRMLVEDLVSWTVMSSNGRYDARSRILIRHISWQLPLQLEALEEIEQHLLEMLTERTEEEKKAHQKERERSEKRHKLKRYALIGLATAGGGALIGLTGGLAAPLVAAGAGAVLGGASAAALSSVAGIAVITSLFGAAGAGLTGYKMKRRMGGIDQFQFQPITASNQLAVTIAVSGWLSNDDTTNFFYPWRSMHQSNEQYTLLWESDHLKRLGKAFEYILDSLVSFAATEALKYTALAGLITAVAWPASLISVAGVIDNPWSVCLQRSAQVGRQLADVLINREHGQRPVTLIGYSLGAKVIFHCLHHLAKKKNHSGIIEDVFLIGAPVSGKGEDWEVLSSVVAGHITNAYCRNDWLLRFLYRTSSRQQQVAGLQAVEWNDRRLINIDLTSIVQGHLDYVNNINTVLSAIGVRTKEMRKSATGCVLLNTSDHNKP